MSFCKYYKQVRQVSYDSGVTWISLDEYQKGDLYENDSPDCGGGITQYKWVNVSGEYTCAGTTKYQKTKKQQSTDGGQTWTDVNPPEYSTGAVIERDSSDCGGGSDYENQYLTFVARESGTFKYSGSTISNVVSYSLDDGLTWNTLAQQNNSPIIQSGAKIMWKGNLTPSDSNIGVYTVKFTSSGLFDIEGNIMSLLHNDNFRGQTSLSGKDSAFGFMFMESKAVNAENLVLPATTLSNSCYKSMFSYCENLVSAPSVLPATTLSEYCYSRMFSGCTSLTNASVISATTLAKFSCVRMFENCTSLTTAPDLLASTLGSTGCCNNMFDGCSSLNYVKCLATSGMGYHTTYNWLSNVSSSGTFVKASSATWERGADGIPTNWTVQNA